MAVGDVPTAVARLEVAVRVPIGNGPLRQAYRIGQHRIHSSKSVRIPFEQTIFTIWQCRHKDPWMLNSKCGFSRLFQAFKYGSFKKRVSSIGDLATLLLWRLNFKCEMYFCSYCFFPFLSLCKRAVMHQSFNFRSSEGFAPWSFFLGSTFLRKHFCVENTLSFIHSWLIYHSYVSR